jgi:hypothetical protein
MTENKFKLGDKVYHVIHGVGTVSELRVGMFQVTFPSFPSQGLYLLDGRYESNNVNPSILTIEEAKAKGYDVPKVKRTVTKELRRWANVYEKDIWIYTTKNEAEFYANNANRIACVELVGSYEVEVEELS